MLQPASALRPRRPVVVVPTGACQHPLTHPPPTTGPPRRPTFVRVRMHLNLAAMSLVLAVIPTACDALPGTSVILLDDATGRALARFAVDLGLGRAPGDPPDLRVTRTASGGVRLDGPRGAVALTGLNGTAVAEAPAGTIRCAPVAGAADAGRTMVSAPRWPIWSDVGSTSHTEAPALQVPHCRPPAPWPRPLLWALWRPHLLCLTCDALHSSAAGTRWCLLGTPPALLFSTLCLAVCPGTYCTTPHEVHCTGPHKHLLPPTWAPWAAKAPLNNPAPLSACPMFRSALASACPLACPTMRRRGPGRRVQTRDR